MGRLTRLNAFETNSSSTHTLIVCSEEDYNKWAGDTDTGLVLDIWKEELVHKEDINSELLEDPQRYYTYERYKNDLWEDKFGYNMESVLEKREVDGKDVIIFGFYGHDY